MSKKKKPATIETDTVQKYPGKKDKKKWCRGKVGILHKYKWEYKPWSWKVRDGLSSHDFEFICQSCGRKEYNSAFDGLATIIALSAGAKDSKSGVAILLRLLNKKIQLEDIV